MTFECLTKLAFLGETLIGHGVFSVLYIGSLCLILDGFTCYVFTQTFLTVMSKLPLIPSSEFIISDTVVFFF